MQPTTAYPRHTGGVSFGGLTTPPETAEQIEARRAAMVAYQAAFALTPEGRFTRAASLIWRATGDERLLNCASRGLAENAGLAASLLAGMSGPAADECRAALAQFRVAA